MNYRQKYLKYKKYLNLKMKGGQSYDADLDEAFKNNKTYVSLNKDTTDKFSKNKYASTYGELTLAGFNELMLNKKF